MSMAAKHFENKTALITGGSRGIGLAVARELSRRGARCAIAARGAERLERARASLAADGFDVLTIQADIADAASCADMVSRAVAEFGRLDILVNNAGVSMRANLEDLDAEACRSMVDINLMGCIYPTLSALDQLKSKKGSVVFTSSIAGLIGLPTATIYCATKHALRGFADALRCEIGPSGAHVGVVYVGFTENDPEKKVVSADGGAIPPGPAHMTQEQVAREFAELIRHRRSRAVLSPIGKLAEFAGRLSPDIVGDAIVFSRKTKLNERFGIT